MRFVRFCLGLGSLHQWYQGDYSVQEYNTRYQWMQTLRLVNLRLITLTLGGYRECCAFLLALVGF